MHTCIMREMMNSLCILLVYLAGSNGRLGASAQALHQRGIAEAAAQRGDDLTLRAVQSFAQALDLVIFRGQFCL